MHSATKVAKHFVNKANAAGQNDMTPLKLLKIVYIAHGWMLGLYNIPLVSEDIEAWQYGPVIPELYRDTKMFGRKHIWGLPPEYDVDLTEEEDSIVRQTFDGYTSYTANELVRLTHQEGTPWHQVTGGKRYGLGIVIPNDIIGKYYYDLIPPDRR